VRILRTIGAEYGTCDSLLLSLLLVAVNLERGPVPFRKYASSW
jgi:hypothetical protein